MNNLLRRFLTLSAAPSLIPTAVIQNVSYTGTAGAATAISANEAPGRTQTVRLCATSDCYYLRNATVTASTGTLLPAGVVEYIRVGNGDTISVIQVSAGGALNVTTMADVSTP